MRTLLRSAPQVAPPAWDAKQSQACSGTKYTDGRDLTPIDVVTYQAAYGCVETGGWLFAVTTFDSWQRSALDFYEVRIDADLLPATGCGGFEYAVVGFYDAATDDLLAGVFRAPTCNPDDLALASSASLLQPTPQDAGLLFDNLAIGDPAQLRWFAEIAATSDADPERLPKSGSNVEQGYLDECPTASAGGSYVTQSSQPGLASQLRGAGLTRVRQHGYGIVTFDAPGHGVARAAARAIDAGLVVDVNHRRSWSVVPNDPIFPRQWSLQAVRAPQAWDLTRGSRSIAVAVLDSGVDATHPQLAGKLLPGYDSTTGAALASGNTDDAGHGTAVTGVVAAATNDGSGLASLGWETRVIPVKVGGPDGSTTADLAEGIRWAVDAGARLLNISLGSCTQTEVERSAIAFAESRNVLVVASAGNSGAGAPASYPAAYPSVLAVGATGFDSTVAVYSNTGPYVDLVAPGGSGDGVADHSIRVLRAGGGETVVDGTSFSSPLTAAAAALIYSRTPSATPASVRAALTSTAVDRGPAGRDDAYGAGQLDAAAAVATAGSTTPSPTPTSAPVAPTLAAPTTATAGVLITVGGSARPGDVVELFGVTAPNATITRVNTPAVVADDFGRWSKTIRPLRNVNLQARVGSLVSPTRFIAVSTAVRQSVAPLAGCIVQVAGSVFEPKPGATVFIRALDRTGRTVSLGTGLVEADGRFLLRKPYACGEPLAVYTVISGDNVNRPGGTPTQQVTTRR